MENDMTYMIVIRSVRNFKLFFNVFCFVIYLDGAYLYLCVRKSLTVHICVQKGDGLIFYAYTLVPYVESDVTRVVVVSNAIGPFSQTFRDNITIKKSTAPGGRMKEVNERSFIFVHQHGGDDVT